MGNIFQSINEAMGDIEPIAKGRKNQSQGFQFRGIDDIMNELQPVLHKHGLFVVPEAMEVIREEKQTKSGGALLYSIVKMKYTFYAIDGTNISAIVIGEGMDSGDKASNKAMAVAMKYALLQVFCIPTEDTKDPDTESHTIITERQKETEKQSIVLEGYIASGIVSGENKDKAQRAIDTGNLENIIKWNAWAKKQEEGK